MIFLALNSLLSQVFSSRILLKVLLPDPATP